MLVHHDHLARLHFADEDRVYRVESACLRCDHMGRLAGQRDVPDAQRSEAKRVAQGDQLVGRDHAARVGAYDSREGTTNDVLPRPAVSVLDESGHHLGVQRRLKRDPLLGELRAQRLRVEQVAVVCDRPGPQRRVMERERVRILGAARACGRVARVAKRDQ